MGGWAILQLEWPLSRFWGATRALAAKVRFPPILWKNNVLQAQKVAF